MRSSGLGPMALHPSSRTNQCRMTAEEYCDALSRLGLTLYGAGKLLGVDPRTSRRWAQEPGISSTREVPGPVTHFLRLLLAKGISGDEALQALGLAKRARRASKYRETGPSPARHSAREPAAKGSQTSTSRGPRVA